MSPSSLQLKFGQASLAGNKPTNQDYVDYHFPPLALKTLKGVAFAIADGISSSNVSQVASSTAVRSFLSDYYSTPETWTVERSLKQVLRAINSWLYAQTRNSEHRYNIEKGYVCTFSTLILKGQSLYIGHIGDTRVYRFSQQGLQQLTRDHKVQNAANEYSLEQALGMREEIDIDYITSPIHANDVYLLMSDGVYEFIQPSDISQALERHPDNYHQAANSLIEQALHNGSKDNLSVQIIHITELPKRTELELNTEEKSLPMPNQIEAGQEFDGYRIIRNLHTSTRSQVFLAVDKDTNQKVAIKIPSIEQRGDAQYLEQFMMEEWIARRLNSPHILASYQLPRARAFFYTVSEFFEGQTLAQWAQDNPAPTIEKVRSIVEQIAKGLRVFHRLEMLHQDIRPENILIDHMGLVKIIDFGSTYIKGLTEFRHDTALFPGTALYMASEYFLGELPDERSDQFSLAILTYFLLSHRYPYGTNVAKAKSLLAQRRLTYQSVRSEKSEIPAFIDTTLNQATQINPQKRYDDISEFIHDLYNPNPNHIHRTRLPIMERHPVQFWQLVSTSLLILVLILTWKLIG